MKAIYKSINDRSKIKASLFNVKQIFKSIISLERMKKYHAAAMDINKVNRLINKEIEEAVNELAAIEPLCKIYHELFAGEFQETKEALHRIIKRQKLVPCNSAS